MKILLTGASGFIGSHVLRHLLTNTDAELICPVTFRHRGNADRLESALKDRDQWHRRTRVAMYDLTGPASAPFLRLLEGVDFFCNVASESHVDRSITAPVGFVETNVKLILNVLERALAQMDAGALSHPNPPSADA